MPDVIYKSKLPPLPLPNRNFISHNPTTTANRKNNIKSNTKGTTTTCSGESLSSDQSHSDHSGGSDITYKLDDVEYADAGEL